MKFKNLFYLLIIISLFSCNKINKYEKIDSGIIVKLDTGYLRAIIYGEEMVRITCSPKASFSARESLIINCDPENVNWDVTEENNKIVLSTHKLTIEIEPNTGLCKFLDQDGNVRLLENEKRISAQTVMEEDVFNVFQSFQLSKEEALYGLGQHQDGIMNWRGHEVTLVQTNVHAVIPFLVSTNNYGILWDNCSKTIFNDDDTGASFWSEVADEIDYYYIAGNNMDEVISGYRDLTGKAPMFGKWAFGYWQSKERYKDANELMGIVKEYRDRKIPIDNIVQDWCYWADYDQDDNDKTWKSAKANWSSMQYHPSTYTDPMVTLNEIHDKYNMHYMISIWPALGPETDIFKEMQKENYLFPAEHWSSGFLYDAYSKNARDIYWNHIKEGLMSKGVDALWMDGTEPELGDQHTFDVSETNIKKFGHSEIGSMARYLNAFSLVTTEGVYNNWRKDFPDKRVFILTRSGFAGQQRNAAVTWSGDINATWEIFRKQISAGLNFSMAGVPYWTMDIGAFFLHGHDMGHGAGNYESYEDMDYRELYVRWFQYGAFCPIFRSHGTHTPREVWRFGEPGDDTYESLLKFDNLRYRLLPYIYSTAWKVTYGGYTMMRGLAMDFPEDRNVLGINNQFMFGSSMMITPVTIDQYFSERSTLTDEVKGFETYLPAEYQWYDFWTGDKIEGGQKVWRPTPLDIMPIYIKAGSIIPMGPFKQYATEIPEDPIELRIYSGQDGRFVLYEDENDNYNYENNVAAIITFTWDDSSNTLTIYERIGEFPGMLKERTFNIVLVSEKNGVGVDVSENISQTIIYSGEKMEVTF